MAKKLKEIQNVRCFDCERAALLQWDKNPVVAHCRNHSYPMLANTLRECTDFKKRTKEPDIRHLTHFK